MVLYWIKENKYYKLFEQETLFGTIDIVCIWGRIGGKLGNYKIIPCKNEYEVQKVVEQVEKRRIYRGYKVVV
jgi:predicted DNA-binding WGR domain protein